MFWKETTASSPEHKPAGKKAKNPHWSRRCRGDCGVEGNHWATTSYKQQAVFYESVERCIFPCSCLVVSGIKAGVLITNAKSVVGLGLDSLEAMAEKRMVDKSLLSSTIPRMFLSWYVQYATANPETCCCKSKTMLMLTFCLAAFCE